VTKKETVADGIFLFELRDPDGAELPAFTPGSHVTVEVPNGSRRNYSLCSDPAVTSHYQIAIKRDDSGRGGSISMADDVVQGQLLSVSAPRNNFELSERAKSFLFVAGGIGVTPIISMMRHLKNAGVSAFKLYYLTRDAKSTAFLKELADEFPGQVKIHHDNGERDQAMDLWPVFEKPANSHIYCCGPQGLMDLVKDMSGHWPSGNVHFESFGVNAKVNADNKPFKVHLAKSGLTLDVGEHETILDVLRTSGQRVPSSCESGTCGSCRTRLLKGEAEHRDMVLNTEEHSTQIMVCISRSKSPELTLDL
jgi:phthalate 4,5-dioxygenase reductase subunit